WEEGRVVVEVQVQLVAELDVLHRQPELPRSPQHLNLAAQVGGHHVQVEDRWRLRSGVGLLQVRQRELERAAGRRRDALAGRRVNREADLPLEEVRIRPARIAQRPGLEGGQLTGELRVGAGVSQDAAVVQVDAEVIGEQRAGRSQLRGNRCGGGRGR